MEHESDGDTICNCDLGTVTQRIDKRSRGLRNKWTSGDYSNYRIIEIVQNTEKSPGNLRKLAVTYSQMGNRRFIGKNLGVIIIIIVVIIIIIIIIILVFCSFKRYAHLYALPAAKWDILPPSTSINEIFFNIFAYS